MKTEQIVSVADDKFYRLRFDFNNTSTVIVTIKDSVGGIIYSGSGTGASFDRIFYTGTLPPVKDITIIFEFQDVLDCTTNDFYVEMLTNVSFVEVEKWTAWVETYEPDCGTFIDYLEEDHATISGSEGETYNPFVYYCVDTTILEPGCYKVRIFGATIQSNYSSQCLRVCDINKELKYLSWNHRNKKCIGDKLLDWTVYGKDEDRHLWIKADLQDLSYNDTREVYKRSDGFSVIAYVESHGVEVLQIWSSPDYVRFAIVLMMNDTFYINGVAYQKLEDEAIAPLFNVNPNSPLRILVQRVGNFVISKNIL